MIDLDAYERVRPRYRELLTRVLAERRVRLSEAAIVLFENRDTVLWQVHEVLRCEGRTASIDRVLADYEPILPASDELRATVMIDGATPERARSIANALGLEGGLDLRCGGISCRSAIAAPPCSATDPVWYLRWRPSPAWLSRSSERDVPLWIRPAWSSSAVLVPTPTRRQLCADLAGERKPLLDALHGEPRCVRAEPAEVVL